MPKFDTLSNNLKYYWNVQCKNSILYMNEELNKSNCCEDHIVDNHYGSVF